MKTNIFFAIPCGEFFSSQLRVVHTVCKRANINPIIIEEHTATADLWEKIIEQIDSADYFVADVSSLSPNILLELGYAIREKRPKNFSIFIAGNIRVPSDLQGFKLQKYISLQDFQYKLVKWISDNVSSIRKSKSQEFREQYEYREEFKNYDTFLKLWAIPPQCAFQLTHEGLRLTDAHLPMMTTHLGLLRDCEFEFKAKIESSTLGWVVKGTKAFENYFPNFFIMFNVNKKGNLNPHIFNTQKPGPVGGYKVFEDKSVKVRLKISRDGWFTITNRLIGDKITILNGGKKIFSADFKKPPYRDYYSFNGKQGQIGFRCYPGEQGTINYVKVTTLI